MSSFEEMRARLLRKYVEIRRLRTEPTAEAPKNELRALASEFPGALRELDALSLEAIDARIAALEGATAHDEPRVSWLGPMDLFHRRLRGALAAKRWLAENAPSAAAELPEEARAWRDELEAIAAAPRLVPLVIARVTAELDLEPDAARALMGFDDRGARRDD